MCDEAASVALIPCGHLLTTDQQALVVEAWEEAEAVGEK